MTDNIVECRRVPRIEIKLPLTIQPVGISARTIDLSEEGLSLTSKFSLPQPVSTIKVKLPNEIIDVEVKSIWVRHDKATNRHVTGLQFCSLTEESVLRLRKALLKYEMRKLLRRAKDPSKQMILNEFVTANFFTLVAKLLSFQATRDFEAVYSLKTQEEISKLSDEFVREGNRLESRIDDKIIVKQLKGIFRRLVGHWAFQSEVMRRGFEKPNGYPGDYYLLELIYTNKPVSKTAFGIYFDGYFLNNPYANAVRNRKDAMVRILWRSLSVAQRPMHILNIASGSCRDIQDICLDSSLNVKAQITFSCFDQDKRALDFSKQSLVNLPCHLRSKVMFKFIKGDVLNFSKQPNHFRGLFGHPDIIYSIGLADYLPDRVLRNVLKFCHEILAPEGQLVIAFKDKAQDEFAPIPPDWFCDWKFIPRTADDIRSVLEPCKFVNSTTNLEWEWSHKILFVTVRKK